jgi:hypothetical protein
MELDVPLEERVDVKEVGMSKKGLYGLAFLYGLASVPHYPEVQLDTSYAPQDEYVVQFHQDRADPSRFLPCTTMSTFPKSGNEGLYGWTWSAKSGQINVRDDLQGEFKTEVDVHESIHTPNEYETRRLTEWIMNFIFPKKLRYWKMKEYKR